jgi:hypothetical protein
MKKYIFACALAASVAVSGCVGYESKTTTTGPSTTGSTDTVAGLVGTWQSVSGNVIPSPSSCTDFKWTPTQQSPTSAMGSFSATCAGGLKVSGTAAGTLSGTTITWSANAIANTAEIPSCNVSLTGTAELGVNSIRVPYSGTTCLGPVSGVEVLDKR